MKYLRLSILSVINMKEEKNIPTIIASLVAGLLAIIIVILFIFIYK